MIGLTPLALLFTLSAIGISETVYLIKKRKAEEIPVCFIGSGCHDVLESKYNKILGVHNDILGLIFYIFVCTLSALILIEAFPISILKTVDVLIIISGAVMSIYFTFLQAFVIKKWCFWCLMSALTVFVMTIIVILSGFMI
ncbi:MAG TPA: vitamin K epoxide reductase family protein [Patescibacteria group bacterium]